MRRALIAGLLLSFSLVAVSADAATHCVDPKTKKFITCPATKPPPKPLFGTGAPPKPPPPKPVTPPPKPATRTTPSAPPTCKTGKPCGKACIPKDKVCHVH